MKMKMRKLNKWFPSILGVVASLVISSTAMAEEVPLENPLPEWGGWGTDTIDFTNIAINYIHGKKKKKGIISDAVFFAQSTDNSVFNLNGPGDRGTVFDGDLVIDAHISSRGRLLKKTSSFGIYSTEVKFAGYETEYACNKKGKNCSTGNLVYGGTITDFGWSSSGGILDFVIENLSGWAYDTWVNSAPIGHTEHLRLNTKDEFGEYAGFDLGGVSSVKKFSAMADGFAVVPVPAAAWLFGSGLIGLVGLARLNRA